MEQEEEEEAAGVSQWQKESSRKPSKTRASPCRVSTNILGLGQGQKPGAWLSIMEGGMPRRGFGAVIGLKDGIGLSVSGTGCYNVPP